MDGKRIADPVHGTIPLNDDEIAIVDTKAFQRLRNVRQLGLAHYVFPGADYSRFSHSLGVCHVLGRILDALRTAEEIVIDDGNLYRIASLLHDVGHYPFSHAMEEAIKEAYFDSYLEGSAGPIRVFNHERVGREVLAKDEELATAIGEAKLDPGKVSAIFMREELPQYVNLISSDLDADRIDYLMRTAHYTGLPYGDIDLDYLLSQVRLDSEHRVCLTHKAMRTAEHFLLARYFDYQQVAFQKTVAALELVLKDVLVSLIKANYMDCSADAVTRMIETGQWAQFDDSLVLQMIRSFANDSTQGEIGRYKSRAVLERIPPSLVYEHEYLDDRNISNVEGFRAIKQVIISKIPGWAEKYGINDELWYVWVRSGITLTKTEAYIPASRASDVGTQPDEHDDYFQVIRILNRIGNESVPLTEIRSALISPLSQLALYSIRVYVLIPEDKAHLQAEIASHIQKDALPTD